MSLIYDENENMNNFLLNCPNDFFLIPNTNDISDMNDNTDNHINVTKDEPQVKQQIKFVLTRQSPPQDNNFLQKKTTPHINGLEHDSGDSNNGRWDRDEQSRFAEAVFLFGNDWKKIQNHVSSRNITQVRSHAQKFLMKLKESKFLANKGLEKNLSWTKVINFLNNTLSYDELKEVLFSVEQTGQKKSGKKAYKNLKKIKKNNNLDKNLEKSENLIDDSRSNSNSDTNNSSIFCNENDMNENNFINLGEEIKKIKHKIVEKEEKEMLQKLIECFNPKSSENINLNTSFEENSYKEEEENNIGYELINDTKVKFNNNYNII